MMATQEDVRRIALSLPGAEQEEKGFAFGVRVKGKRKGFAWVWQERVHPKQPKTPCAEVIALRVADEAEKQMLIASDGDKFFTEPHYNNYPAILVRLSAIDTEELTELIVDAWRYVAPTELHRTYEQRTEED